jgi:hypothetical protein
LQKRPARKVKTGYSGTEAPFSAGPFARAGDFQVLLDLKSRESSPIFTQQHKTELL